MKYRLIFTELLVGTFVLAFGIMLSAPMALATEQVFRWGHQVTDMDTVDPAFDTGGAGYTAAGYIFNGLVRLPPGTVDFDNIEGDLARNWTVSADGLTYTFHLRRGVQWHKGYGEFTAEDVKYTFDRLRNTKVGSPYGAKYLGIKEVKILDRYTVQFILKAPNPFFLIDQVLAFQAGNIVCKEQGKEHGAGNLGIMAVGTGPFQVEKYISKEKLILVRNENYFRGSPYLERVEYCFMPDIASRTLAFVNGELDAIVGEREPKWVEDIMKTKTAVVDTIPLGSGCVLHFNMTKKPLDNFKVRKALTYAMDRKVFHQYFGSLATEMTAPVPATYFGALPREKTPEDLLYNYDLGKAKKFLTEAGYGAGFKLQACTTAKTYYTAVYEILAELWKPLGVELKIRVVDHTTYHHNIRADMNDVVFYYALRAPVADSYLTQYYHSEAIVKKPHAITNFSHYGDLDADGDGKIDNIDSLIEKARSEVNPERQKQLYYEAQLQLLKHVASKPIYELIKVYVRHNYVDLGCEIKGNILGGYPLETARILKH